MSIPASYIVAINPRLITAGGTDLEFNGLILTKNSLIPQNTFIVEFTSTSAVGDYFGTTSTEYALASNYFLGYNNSFSKPKKLYFGARVDTASSAYLRGAEFSGTLETIQAITDGAFDITVDGTDISVSGLDFSECTSYSEAAEKIENALAAVVEGTTCTYSSLTGAFTITSPTVGADSTITYATAGESETNIVGTLGLASSDGATLSQGSDALTPTANMAKFTETTQNFVTFTTLYEAEDDEVLELSQWASDQGVDYLYVAWSSNTALATQGATDTIADQIEAAETGATALVYNSAEVAVFVLGMIGSIDWERWNGTISTAFKKQDGLAATVTTESAANLLEAKKVNYIGKFATRNDDFTFFYNGAMFGDYSWIDTYINAIWLKNVLQVSIVNGLTSVGRVPYNARGYAFIRAWLLDPINRALKNGCIDTGVELSESQIAQINSEAGTDIDSEVETKGYYIQVADAGASVRTTRESPNVSIWYTYGGSVNRVEVASTAVL